MATYEVTIEGKGTYEVNSDKELTDAQAYQYALAQSKSEATPSAPVSALAGLGAGFGRTVLGGQELLGKGLQKVGAETIGQMIERDAQMGREKLSQELDRYKQANPFSAGSGQLVGEIGATLPVGGLLAKGLSAVPAISARAAPLIEAIRTAGGSAGGAGLGTRAAGGAITGGLGSAMIDQESAGTGAAIGAVLPVVGAGVSRLMPKATQTPEMASAINAAREAGYVIPPTQANPTLLNRVLEGTAGKLTTAQNASARNQEVTNKLAARSLGLADDTPITPELLSNIRATAGEAYDAIANSGLIRPKLYAGLTDTGMLKMSSKYSEALDDIAKPFVTAAKGFPESTPSPVIDLVNSLKSNSFDASSAVSMIKQLRTGADDAFRSGNTDVGRASKSIANLLENSVEEHLKKTGSADLLKEFRNSRQLIAKTYSIEKVLNQTTGSVDAVKLAGQLQKGKPLSGELRQAAEFAQAFPKAARTPEQMGSLPQFSPLDVTAGAGISAILQNPAYLATLGVRPAARSAALSPYVQNRLVQNPNDINKLLELLRTATPPAITGLYSE
jgi:hypothetical protein